MGQRSNNLTYESNEPAFLRRLKGEFGHDGASANARSLARPRKKRDVDQEDEDAPVYLDADGREAISKSEYDTLLKEANSSEANDGKVSSGKSSSLVEAIDQAERSDAQQSPKIASQQQAATLVKSSKRRLIKAIGHDAGDDESDGQYERPTAKFSSKSTKKPKKVKLSFEEEP